MKTRAEPITFEFNESTVDGRALTLSPSWQTARHVTRATQLEHPTLFFQEARDRIWIEFPLEKLLFLQHAPIIIAPDGKQQHSLHRVHAPTPTSNKWEPQCVIEEIRFELGCIISARQSVGPRRVGEESVAGKPPGSSISLQVNQSSPRGHSDTGLIFYSSKI